MIVIQSLEVFLTKKRLESQDSLHYISVQLEKKRNIISKSQLRFGSKA